MPHTLLIRLILLVAYAGSARGIRCYQCADPELQPFAGYNCSNPFEADGTPTVTIPNGKCMSRSFPTSMSGIAERGGITSSCTNGCFWYADSRGNAEWRCCCDADECNSYHEPMDGFECYSCTGYTCPNPFDASNSAVKKVKAPFGYCYTIRYTNAPVGKIHTRGYAPQGVCTENGCSWKMIGGTNQYVCCSDSNLSNIATSITVSSAIISNVLVFLHMAVKIA